MPDPVLALALRSRQCLLRAETWCCQHPRPLAVTSSYYFWHYTLFNPMQRLDQEHHEVTTPLTSTSQFIEAGVELLTQEAA